MICCCAKRSHGASGGLPGDFRGRTHRGELNVSDAFAPEDRVTPCRKGAYPCPPGLVAYRWGRELKVRGASSVVALRAGVFRLAATDRWDMACYRHIGQSVQFRGKPIWISGISEILCEQCLPSIAPSALWCGNPQQVFQDGQDGEHTLVADLHGNMPLRVLGGNQRLHPQDPVPKSAHDSHRCCE